MKIQIGANDGGTITIDLKKTGSDTPGLNGFSINGRGTIINKTATVSDLTSAGARLDTTTGLCDLKTENILLATDTTFDKLRNDDKVIVGDVDYTYSAKSGDFTTTRSIVDTGVDAAAQAIDSAKKRDTLAATLHANVDKSASGSYTTEDGTVSLETDSAGNIIIGGSQAYADDAGNLMVNNVGSTAKADMEALLKAVSEGGDGASLTSNDTEYTIAKAAPATTSPVAPLIPDGIAYQATVNKDVVLSGTKTAVMTSSITLNSGVLSRTIGFTVGESSDATKSYVDDRGGITNVADYTAPHNVNKDSGFVAVAGYASATDTNKDYAPATGTAVDMNSADKITTETTSVGSATTNPLTTLDDAISSVGKFCSSLGAIQDRPDSTVTSLNNTTTNLSETQSRIQGADYTAEMPNMSKAQITQQANNSVLARADQASQQALFLLQG